MAITIITQPDNFAPVYNPMIFTCSSTNVAQVNFKFVFDIVIGAVTKRIKLSARPDTYGLIDVHRVLESYLSYDFTVADNQGLVANANSYLDYTINFYEEYGTTPAVSSLMATTSLKALNMSLKYSIGNGGGGTNFVDYNPNDYNIATGATNAFLTSSPRTITIDDRQNYYLYYYTTSTFSSSFKIRFIYYNAAGAALSTRDVSMNANKYNRVACGTQNIYQTNPGDLTNCTSYTVQLMSSILAPMSELFTFNIVAQCTKTIEHFRLQFLNPLGGFDAFNFNYTFKRSFEIKKSNFQKMLGSMDGGGAFTFTESQQGKVQFNTIAKEKILITSDWVTEEESIWLNTLAMSPQIFWEKDYNTIIPVVVTNTSYQQKTYAVDNKLFALELTIEISNDIIRQRQ